MIHKLIILDELKGGRELRLESLETTAIEKAWEWIKMMTDDMEETEHQEKAHRAQYTPAPQLWIEFCLHAPWAPLCPSASYSSFCIAAISTNLAYGRLTTN